MAWVLIDWCVFILIWAVATYRRSYEGSRHDCLRPGKLTLPGCHAEAHVDARFAALVVVVVGVVGLAVITLIWAMTSGHSRRSRHEVDPPFPRAPR